LDLDTFDTAGNYSLSIISNNPASTPVTVGFNIGALPNNADSLAQAISAFNDKSAQTGITAKINTAGTGITITNDAGADIFITSSTAAGNFNVVNPAVGPIPPAAAVPGTPITIAAAGTAYITGAISLDSNSSFSIGSPAGAAATGVSYFVGLTAASELQAASTMDVSTVDAATRTLSTVDSSLATISSQRAKFGALQSRFETTISSLSTTGENLSASRSRIQDADFAMETANLSRTQILQQAGTAMVAQANQLPQSVLQLLKG
jgi:flagellin